MGNDHLYTEWHWRILELLPGAGTVVRHGEPSVPGTVEALFLNEIFTGVGKGLWWSRGHVLVSPHYRIEFVISCREDPELSYVNNFSVALFDDSNPTLARKEDKTDPRMASLVWEYRGETKFAEGLVHVHRLADSQIRYLRAPQKPDLSTFFIVMNDTIKVAGGEEGSWTALLEEPPKSVGRQLERQLGHKLIGLRRSYGKIFEWYKKEGLTALKSLPGSDRRYKRLATKFIGALPTPSSASVMDIEFIAAEVLTGLLEFGYQSTDIERVPMNQYARLILGERLLLGTNRSPESKELLAIYGEYRHQGNTTMVS